MNFVFAPMDSDISLEMAGSRAYKTRVIERMRMATETVTETAAAAKAPHPES